MKIGFTTSFPVEIVFAAGHTPVDLNNIFVTGSPAEDTEFAEFNGYPRNVCAWIKGMYSVALKNNINTVIGIVEGDCSNTHSLMDTLRDKDIDVITFSFPHQKNKKKLEEEIFRLENIFDVSHDKVLKAKRRLDRIRKKLVDLDKFTYSENKITGSENHYWLINSTDFQGAPDKFEKKLDTFLLEAENRQSFNFQNRLAFIGVPPIISDLYVFLESLDTNIVFNEIQRQFSMPYLEKNLINQYSKFTYPYSVFDRIKDIKQECKKRNIDGIISYVQSFCHRQIDNMLLRKYIDLPFLTLEGDQPGALDERSKLRIESFIEMLE